MPFVEMGTSRQDIAYDSEGNATMTRTFKVWDVNPETFWTNIGNIPNQTNTDFLPEHGDVLAVLAGPPGSVGNVGVETKLRLYRYVLRPVSPLVFMAIAIYTNDPRLVPYGTTYQTKSTYSWVQIPYVRKLPVIVAGSSSTANSPFSYTEHTIPQLLQSLEITQTVSILRSKRREAETAAINNTGTLNELPEHGWSRFDGASFRTRSPQWLDVTYTWVREYGIVGFDIGGDAVISPQNADIRATYPPRVFPASSLLTQANYILPPYHTIELMFGPEIETGLRTPIWVRRLQHGFNAMGHDSLEGSDNFEWKVNP